MKGIQVLDCTLRDGGRILNCEFDDTTIMGMSKELAASGIDIVEMGFLRDSNMVNYKGNSTFFTHISQITQFLPKEYKNTLYVAFIDFNMYNFDDLSVCDGTGITGIRVGFTKKQFIEQRNEIINSLKTVKDRGYKLFVQGVNSLAYSDRELLDLLDMINEIEPFGFGIVDTYGAMYLEDLVHYYNVVDYNLKSSVSIDVHSHNNFQSSFAFAQEIIRLANGKRNIILDATLNGMGKCAGNLNTELIVDYLVRKKYYDYNIDKILDTIDRYLAPLKERYSWGYSIPAFMAGIYKSHPNNIIYLTEKYRLNSRDIKYIISEIDEETRQRYDYDNLQKIYKKYNENRIDDQESVEKIRNICRGRSVVVLAPGKSVDEYEQKIHGCISEEKAVVISVNFIPRKIPCDFYFYANTIHWEKASDYIERDKCILSSNIHTETENTIMVDYSSIIEEDSKLYDNSTIMLLNLLKKSEPSKIFIAGFDGLRQQQDNYVDNSFLNIHHTMSIDEINEEVKRLFQIFKNKTTNKINVQLLTPSLYEEKL